MYRLSIVLLCSLLGVAACGGGSSSGSASTDQPTVLVQGPITGFGSVIVNGIKFDSSTSTFVVEDNEGSSEQDLSVGDYVSISGTVSDDGVNGTALQIRTDSLLEGSVSSVDTVNNQIVVLGQTVEITPTTIFDNQFTPASLAGVTVGTTVEIHGVLNGNIITASRIEPKAVSDTELEVHGIVSSLDDMVKSFSLNGLTVDYNTAIIDDSLPNGLVNGALVEVKGTQFDDQTNVLVATKVDSPDSLGSSASSDFDEVHIEGYISAPGTSQFTLGQYSIQWGAGTQFENGNSTNLIAGQKVQVEGSFIDNSTLNASKISIKSSNAVRISGVVESKDETAMTFSVMGVQIEVNLGTTWKDDQSDIRNFNLNVVSIGDFVEVRGAVNGANAMLASLVERDDVDESLIRGIASNVSDPNLTLLGVNVVTTGSTQFEDVSDNIISSGQFFSGADGQLVQAKGSFSGSTLTATEVEFEN